MHSQPLRADPRKPQVGLEALGELTLHRNINIRGYTDLSLQQTTLPNVPSPSVYRISSVCREKVGNTSLGYVTRKLFECLHFQQAMEKHKHTHTYSTYTHTHTHTHMHTHTHRQMDRKCTPTPEQRRGNS